MKRAIHSDIAIVLPPATAHGWLSVYCYVVGVQACPDNVLYILKKVETLVSWPKPIIQVIDCQQGGSSI